MAFEGWLQFAGTELINAARTAVYAGKAGIRVECGGCPELAASLGDEPYTDAASDDAPWFDPVQPESKDFHGLIGLELTGASDSTRQREVTEFLGDGGVLGAPRSATREIEVKAVAVASSREALSYGLGWLDTALSGSVCHSGCGGDVLCLYAACPTRPVTASGDECGGWGAPDPNWNPVAGGDAQLRQLFNVARTEGPTRESIKHVRSGWFAEVSFTLTAGNPWWWRMPRFAFDQTRPPDFTDRVVGYDPLGEPCPTPTDCLDSNPYCSGANRPWPDEPFPGSDPNDTTLMDPCFPTKPFTARRAMWRVPMTAMPEWNATVPIFSISSGSLPLHRVTLRWYSNPRNQNPSGHLDRCTACAEMTIPWVPSNTTLTIDSRTHQVTVNCRGQGRLATSVPVYGPRGGAYAWPAFDCGVPLIAELVALDSSLATNAEWNVQLAARTGAV